MVQLDSHGPAQIADVDIGVQPAVAHPQVVKMAQRRASEETKLRMIPLGLELGNHDQWQDDPVLSEPADGAGVGKQDARVEHVGAAVLPRLWLGGVRRWSVLA